MTLASGVLRHLQRLLAKVVGPAVLLMLLVLTSCNEAPQPRTDVSENVTPTFFAPRPALKQVETPALIQELTPWLDTYSPQVQIHQPKADQVFDVTTVKVSLRVQDLPIYKDETWGMGPHLEMLLDNQPHGSIYDLDQPIILEDLAPGTHTLRVFAARPWHESFKNEGSYAQVTFHVFAKTGENAPIPNQPLLTYGSPQGAYGAEPVLLDFYLTEAPLHQVAQDNPAIADWRVRYTLNGESLTLKDWQPIYIEGLKPGKNWIQLALVDQEGNPLEGVFNNTVRLIDYDPALNNTLAKIVGGDLTLEEVGRIIDPTYEPPVIEPPAPPVPETPMAPALNEGEDLEGAFDHQAPTVEEMEPATLQPREPEVREPEVVNRPEVNEPEVNEPKVNGPEVGEPEVNKPEVREPKVREPEVREPKVREPEVRESEINKPEVRQSDPFDPATESFETEMDSTADDGLLPPSRALAPAPSETSPPKNERSDLEKVESSAAVDTFSPQETPEIIQPDNSERTTAIKSKADDAFNPFDNETGLPADTMPKPESAPLSESSPSTEAASTEDNGPDSDTADLNNDANDTEELSPPKQRYFQRLYDYRERAMKTYGQEGG